MKRVNVLWITGLVLGWFFDFLFWKAGLGINFALYAALVLAGGFLALSLNGVKPSWKALILLAPILFFAAVTFLRQEMLTQFLAFVLTLGLMGLLAITFLGGRWPLYSLSDYIVNYFRLLGSLIARPLSFRSERKKAALATAQAETPDLLKPRQGWKRFWAIFRGVIIALPVLIIFATLLASADLVFAQRLKDFTDLFRIQRLPEYIFRGVYILIGAYALMGAFLHAAQKSRDEKLVGMDKPLVPPFLGFTEASIVLGSVVVLFAAFVLIQFRYFFGGQTNIGLQGFTYSDYARRGFGELVAVAFISLLLFLGLSSIVQRRSSAQRWTFSGLGIGMVVLVAVILVSAFQRLLLYEAAFGFTRLRMYTHIFMIWLGLLLAAVVALELLRKERFFAALALLASVGFATSLALVNVDAAIVRENVARAEAGKGLDVAYLATLSTDSVPVLVAEFQDASVPGMTRDGVGAVLVCRQLYFHDQGDWRGFTVSRWQADRAVEKVQVALDKYSLEDVEWPNRVTTPGNTGYDCMQNNGSSGD